MLLHERHRLRHRTVIEGVPPDGVVVPMIRPAEVVEDSAPRTLRT